MEIKFRYGMNLMPRLEGAKTVRSGATGRKEGLVWDSVVILIQLMLNILQVGVTLIKHYLVP
jgi:hypothetical protein